MLHVLSQVEANRIEFLSRMGSACLEILILLKTGPKHTLFLFQRAGSELPQHEYNLLLQVMLENEWIQIDHAAMYSLDKIGEIMLEGLEKEG